VALGAARVERYIAGMKRALRSVEPPAKGRAYEVFRLAELYTSDAEYYLSRGDVPTALSCIAYAEGLLDALRLLGHINYKWPPSHPRREEKVLVAGTFDIIHPGHIHLLRQAWLLGKVYVVVARDRNVERIKGREPIIPEGQRLNVVSSIRYVYKALLGDEDDLLKPVETLKPDVILLGPDQWPDEERLERMLRERGVDTRIVRLGEKLTCPLCSTTAIACRVLDTFPRERCRERGGAAGI